MPAADPPFGKIARAQQAQYRKSLSAKAATPDDAIGIKHAHLLAHGYESENLYPSLRGPDGAGDYFAKRSIQWWTDQYHTGDRKVERSFAGPTRNLASSQVCCVNFLLPLAEVPGALTGMLQAIDDDVLGVEEIVDARGNRSLVEFEWVGWNKPLEGGGITRGANQTSVDALLVALTTRGRRAYLIEWKYCEEYLNAADKGSGVYGANRLKRYRPLYESTYSSFTRMVRLEDMLFDPAYQIMRMILLGDRMLVEGVTESVCISDFRALVIVPEGNLAYRRTPPHTPLGQLFPGSTIEQAQRATLKQPQRFRVIAQEDVVSRLRTKDGTGNLQEWLAYHAIRYGW